MGNNQTSTTKSTNEIENKLSVNTRKIIENECATSTNESNTLNISNSTVSGSNINLTNEAKNSCKMRAALNELLKTKSDTSLAKQIAESQMSSGGIFNSNKTNTELSTLVSTKVSINKMLMVVNNCMQNTDLSNTLNITNSSVLKSNIKIGNTSFNDCLQKSLIKLADEHGLSNQAEEIVKKTQTQKGGLFGGLKKMIVWGLIIVIIVFLILMFLCRSKVRFIPPFMLVCKLPFLGKPKTTIQR